MTPLPPARMNHEPESVGPGDTVEITYDFSKLPASVESVEISIVDDSGQQTMVTVDRPQSGDVGSINWNIPSNWGDTAVLSEPNSLDHTFPVI